MLCPEVRDEILDAYFLKFFSGCFLLDADLSRPGGFNLQRRTWSASLNSSGLWLWIVADTGWRL